MVGEIRHGTIGGYRRETAEGLPHCEDCKAARSAEARKYRKPRGGGTTTKPVAAKESGPISYYRPIRKSLELAGAGIALSRPLTGVTLEHQAPKIAKGVDAVLAKNQAVARFLEKFAGTVSGASLLVAVAPVLAAYMLEMEVTTIDEATGKQVKVPAVSQGILYAACSKVIEMAGVDIGKAGWGPTDEAEEPEERPVPVGVPSIISEMEDAEVPA